MTGNRKYPIGSLWITRQRLTGYITPPEKRSHKDKIVVIPRKEAVLLLSYKVGASFDEKIQVLWKDKVLFLEDVDFGLQFTDRFT